MEYFSTAILRATVTQPGTLRKCGTTEPTHTAEEGTLANTLVHSSCLLTDPVLANLPVTPKSILAVLCTYTEQWNIWVAHCTHSQLRENRPGSVFLLQLSCCKQVPFWQSLWCHGLHIFVPPFRWFCCKYGPPKKCWALSGVPKCRKVVMGLTEKKNVCVR